MKLYGYMSNEEFSKLTAGCELKHPKKNHSQNRTNSHGFCFLGEQTEFVDSDGDSHIFSPEECLQFLCGIVKTGSILVEFETEPENVEETYGIYCDPYGSTFFFSSSNIEIKEYCTNSYNRDTFKLLRYKATSFDVCDDVWYDIN